MTDLDTFLKELAADTTSGAAQLAVSAAAALKREIGRQARPPSAAEVARWGAALAHAQPSMAPLLSLANSAALEAERRPAHVIEAIDTWLERRRRAVGGISRTARELLKGVDLVVTWSYSSTLELALRDTLDDGHPPRVIVAEGRPLLEGRHLATSLAGAGLTVSLATDGGAIAAVAEADAVLVGADAVAARWFVNKAGTSGLIGAAAQHGCPTYVLAGLDKCLPAALAALLRFRDAHPAEVWRDPPAGVVVINRYFERVALDPVAAVVTESGALAGEAVAQACERQPVAASLVEALQRRSRP